jgi:chorismate synthase
MSKLIFASIAVVAIALGGLYLFYGQQQRASYQEAIAQDTAGAGNAASEGRQDDSQSVERAEDQVEISVEPLKDQAQEVVDKAASEIAKAAEDAQDQVQEQLEEAADQAEDAIGAATKAVSDGVANALGGIAVNSGN